MPSAIEQLDITPFLAKENSRYSLTEPFVVNGWEYATDGHAIICWPMEKSDYASTQKPPPVETLPWYLKGYGEWTKPMPVSPIYGKRICPTCKGTGANIEDLDNAVDDDKVRQCPTCKGDEAWWEEDRYRRLGGILVDSRYYHAVMAIPGIEICAKAPEQAIAFRGDDSIKGFVMPVNEFAVDVGDG